MFVGLLTTVMLAAEPAAISQLPDTAISAPDFAPDRAADRKSPDRPVMPTSATEIFEKVSRLKNQIAENGDEIVRVKKWIETERKTQKEHEKVLKGERPRPQPGDPLIAGTLARTKAYDPKTAIDALTIRLFTLQRTVDNLQHRNERYQKEINDLNAWLEKLSVGPYQVLGTIRLGAAVETFEGARKVAVEPADFNATFGRVVVNDTRLKRLDEAVLRAIFPLLVDVYELDDFQRPDLVREFGKIRLFVERRTGIVFAVGAEWSAAGTEAIVIAPEMAKRTREILTVLQAKYPELKEDNGRIHDSKDQFLSVSVTNERTDANGRKVETATDELQNLKPGEIPPKNSVFLTYTLKSGEKRVIEAVRRIETRHAFGSLEEIKKKGNGL